MAATNNTVVFAAPPTPDITARVATVVVTPAGGQAGAPITLDYVANPSATFSANEGDTFSVTATDANAAGTSDASAAFTGTVTVVTPPPGIPPAPVITGVTTVLA